MESNTESHNQSQWRVVEPSLLIDSYKIFILKIHGSLQKRKPKNYKRQKMGVCCEIMSPSKQRIQAHKVWPACPVKCKLKKGDNNVSAKLHRKKIAHETSILHSHTKRKHTTEEAGPGEVVFPREEHAKWLSIFKWSVLETDK